jgi:hypothetical protein
MKKVILTLGLMLVSANAMAIGPSDSWDAIRANKKYNVSAVFPVLGTAGLFNGCATDSEIRTINPIKVCTEVAFVPGNGELSGSNECVRTEVRHMSLARRGVAPVCVKYAPVNEASNGECLAYEDRPYEIALTQAVDVLFASGTNYAGVAFTKSYTIPACK